jgi:hypothetical protein
MFEWYKGMVDEQTGRLLYTYDPETGVAIGDGQPIRDIATVWDVEVLSAFLGRDDLHDLIRHSLDHFEQRVVPRDGYSIVSPGGESASIAHSAFTPLALARSDLPDNVRRFTPLVDGILRQPVLLMVGGFLCDGRSCVGTGVCLVVRGARWTNSCRSPDLGDRHNGTPGSWQA